MATSTVSGGSMIDVNSLVSGLMKIESLPLTKIQQKIDKANVSISSMGELRAKVDAVYSKLESIQNPFFLGDKAATVADASVATVSVSSGVLAKTGSISVSVTSLARAQRSVISGFTSDSATAASSGTLDIVFSGTLSRAAPNTNQTSISVSGKSLSQIRDLINSDTTNDGRVIASIVKTGVPITESPPGRTGGDYALVLTSTVTGSGASFTAQWPATSDATIASTGVYWSGNPPPSAFNFDLAASSASATIDGIAVVSDSNTLTTASAGLTINLLKASSATSIIVTDNTAAIKTSLTEFATALTALRTSLAQLTKPGSKTEKAGPLAGNSGVLALSAAINSAYFSGITLGSGASGSWSNLGLSVQRDGSIVFKAADFTSYLASNGAGLLTTGFTSQLKTTLNTYKGFGGTIERSSDSLRSEVNDLSDRYSATQKRLDALKATYIAKYSALDSKLSQMNYTSQSVSASLNRLNKD